VISRAHASNLFEIVESDLVAVTLTVQRIARAVRKAFTPDGIRIVQTNGAAAGQSVFHYHVHVIPMREGQRVGAHGRERANPEDLKALAAQIQAALEA
jgi:histidine triad (HIT) family protein